MVSSDILLFQSHALYYAFEARAYSWYVFLPSHRCIHTWNADIVGTSWQPYSGSIHTYMIIVPAVQTLHYLIA